MTSEIVIRSALPSDRAAMFELTREVWEGSDYVPFVWDSWLGDSRGWLMVATLAGQMVGLQHIDLQPDGSAWVEGIRVAENRRGHGIGRMMLRRAIHWAREHDCPWLRLATSSENLASNRIAERNGLGLLGTFASIQAQPELGPRDGARLAAPGEFARILTFLQAQLAADEGDWVYTEGWTAYTLSAERLRVLLAMGAVVVCGEEPEALAIVTMSVLRPSLRLGLLRGSAAGMEKICAWLRARAHESGIAVVRANAEACPDTLAALTSAGFDSTHGHAMMLHGLCLNGNGSG